MKSRPSVLYEANLLFVSFLVSFLVIFRLFLFCPCTELNLSAGWCYLKIPVYYENVNVAELKRGFISCRPTKKPAYNT